LKTDVVDYNVVKFQSDYSLKGNTGKYLAMFEEQNFTFIQKNENTKFTMNNNSTVTTSFLVSVDGQGIGDRNDCLNFINFNQRCRLRIFYLFC
jgi:hypothetical protein